MQWCRVPLWLEPQVCFLLMAQTSHKLLLCTSSQTVKEFSLRSQQVSSPIPCSCLTVVHFRSMCHKNLRHVLIALSSLYSVLRRLMPLLHVQGPSENLCTISFDSMWSTWAARVCHGGSPLPEPSGPSIPADGLHRLSQKHSRPANVWDTWTACVRRFRLCGAPRGATFDQSLRTKRGRRMRKPRSSAVLLGRGSTLC
jgi:hypothetical protein